MNKSFSEPISYLRLETKCKQNVSPDIGLDIDIDLDKDIIKSRLTVKRNCRLMSLFQKEKKKKKKKKKNYFLIKNNSYTIGIPNDNQMDTVGIPLVSKMDTQVRLGKDSIGKDNIVDSTSDEVNAGKPAKSE